jgi:hypothetical protein
MFALKTVLFSLSIFAHKDVSGSNSVEKKLISTHLFLLELQVRIINGFLKIRYQTL